MGSRGSSSSKRITFGQFVKAQQTGDIKTIKAFNNQRIAGLKKQIKEGTQTLGAYNEIERLRAENKNLK